MLQLLLRWLAADSYVTGYKQRANYLKQWGGIDKHMRAWRMVYTNAAYHGPSQGPSEGQAQR
jgi:hypothetical protein